VSPLQFLFLTVAITALGAAGQALASHTRRHRLRKLARKWQMQFACGDRLLLAGRIAEKLPVTGASNVCVYDLLFDSDGSRHRYLFTVAYGLGVLRGKHRKIRVAGFQEPVSRGGTFAANCTLMLAPVDLKLEKAYEHVRDELK
jgi:hypothetical protein